MLRPVLCAVLTAALPAQTIHVVASPAQFQPALDVARDGDVVELHCDVPAVYHLWIRSAVTIRSEPGRVRRLAAGIGTPVPVREIVLERLVFSGGVGIGLDATERVLVEGVTVAPAVADWPNGAYARAPLVVLRDSTLHGASAIAAWDATVPTTRSFRGGTALAAIADVVLIENSVLQGGDGSDLIVDCAAVHACTGHLNLAAGHAGSGLATAGTVLASDSTIAPGRPGVVRGPSGCWDRRFNWVEFTGGEVSPEPPTHAFGARAVTAAAVPGTFRAEGTGWALLGFDLGATATPFGTLATTPLWAERAPFELAVPPVPALRHALVTLQAVEGARLGAPSATWLR